VAKEASSRLPPEGVEAKVIAAFRVRQGGQGLDELVSSCVPLAGIKGALVPIPDRQLQTFFVGFDVSQKVAQICAWANTNSRTSSFANVLDADWKHTNRLIHHADQAKVSAPMPTQKCLQLGWCVCSPEGRVDMQLRNRLFRNIKLQCRVGSEARRLLIGGFVVIELRWARDTRGPSKWSAFALGVDHEDALPADQQQGNEGSLWVHIGSMSLSPYRPTFQLLDKLDDRPASCYVWVRARISFMHEFQLCHHLHKGFTWSMSLYRLVNTDEPVGVFDPRVVPVERLARDDAQRLWPLRGGGGWHRKPHDDEAEPVGAPCGEDVEVDSDEAEDPAGELADEGDVEMAPEVDEGFADDFADLLEAFEAELGEGGEGDVFADETAPRPDDDGPPAPAADEEMPPLLIDHDEAEVVEPAVVEPDAEAPHADGGGRLLGEAVAEKMFEGGKISFYNKGDFVATCHRHARCFLTRTCKASATKPAQGRPLGLLVAWLSMLAATKAQHMDRSQYPSYDDQWFARVELAMTPDGWNLLKHENPRTGEVNDEPAGLP
jgi:hypothetical protein